MSQVIFNHTGFPNRLTEFNLDGEYLFASGANTPRQKVKVNPAAVAVLIKNADPENEQHREQLAELFY